MLERIINISAGSDYKNSSKPNRYSKSSQYLSTFSSALSDSISLSPATAFLSTINWRLKRLTKNENKIVINFEFDGFDFTAYINHNEYQIQNNFEYDINKFFEKSAGKFEVQTLILCPHNFKNRDKLDPKFHLTVLSEMIYQLIDLNYNSYSISVNNIEVNKIFADAEYALRQEFNYINGCLLNFLEKYLTVKVDVINDNQKHDNVLIMKKIHIKTF